MLYNISKYCVVYINFNDILKLILIYKFSLTTTDIRNRRVAAHDILILIDKLDWRLIYINFFFLKKVFKEKEISFTQEKKNIISYLLLHLVQNIRHKYKIELMF